MLSSPPPSPAGSPPLSAAAWQEAAALLRAGRWSEALALSARACAVPEAPALAWHVRGLAALEGGLLAEAIPALKRAALLAPEQPALRGPLGIALLRQGALMAARPHLDAAAGTPWVDTHRGVAAFLAGQPAEALALLRDTTQRLPDEVVGWRYRGLAAQEVGLLPEAAAAWTQVSALAPQDPEGPTMLGMVLGHLDEGEAAVLHLEEALRRAPADPTALRLLGARQLERGALDAAEAAYVRLTAGDPTASAAGRALVAERRGALSEAAQHLAPLLGRPPVPVVAAEAWARVCLRQQRAPAALPVLEQALSEPRPSDDRRVLLHALGDVQDALGDCAAAFAAWTAANQLQRVEFEPAGHDRLIAALLAQVGVRAPSSGASARPVFVVGMPRSGTSLLERMLDRHPGLRGVGERQELARLAQQLQVSGGLAPSAAVAAQLAAVYTARVGADRVVDKMPHNFYHLGLIRQLFPAARVIWLRRRPEDVALSCFRQRFGAGMGYSTRLDWLGCVYRGHEALLQRWSAPDTGLAVLEVRYAALVRAPEPTLREILAFLGEPWEPRCLDHRAGGGAAVATASYAQVQQPLYTSAVGRSAPYQSFLAPFRAALGGGWGDDQGVRGTSQVAPALLAP